MAAPLKAKWPDRVKAWAPPLAAILTVTLALGAGLQYVIKSELSGVVSSLDKIKADIEEIKSKTIPDVSKRLDGTNGRIDSLLSDALKRAFPAQQGKNASVASLETGLAIIGSARKAGVKLDHQAVSNFSMALASRLRGDTAPPQLWEAASEVINYRSIEKLGSMPACYESHVRAEGFPRVGVTFFEDCEIDLSAVPSRLLEVALNHYSRDHLELRRCKVIYRGGAIPLFAIVPRIAFVNCEFFVFATSIPQGIGRQLIAHLLSADNEASTVFDANSGAE